MSLELNRKGTSKGITVAFRVNILGNIVELWGWEKSDCIDIKLEDWLDATLYILSNADILLNVDNDSRLEFIKKVKSMRKIKGCINK